MGSDLGLATRIPSYLRRLVKEYAASGSDSLSKVLAGSLFRVQENTGYDNWNGGMYGHSVAIYVPDALIGLVPLDEQGELQQKVRDDLIKLASAAQNEFVDAVHFEYLEDSEGIPQGSSPIVKSARAAPVGDTSSLWADGTLKLFVSHRDLDKKIAHELANELKGFGVGCFVAHDAIEPDEEWQREIERALFSMDAMLTLITDEFFKSPWTNQEIGFALGRGIPVISIKLAAQDPIGFIKDRQAIKGSPARMHDNAGAIVEVLMKRLHGSTQMRAHVLARFAKSRNFANAEANFDLLRGVRSFQEEEIDALVEAFNTNSQLYNCFALTRNDEFLDFINSNSSRRFVTQQGAVHATAR